VDFDLSPEHQDIQRLVRDFADQEIRPVAEELDREKRFPYEIVAKLGELGLMGIPYPEEYGGAGADTLAYAIAVEELARIDSSVAVTVAAHTSLGTWPILAFGSDEQRAEWLPKLASGEATGAFGGFDHRANGDAESTLFCDLPTADVVVTFHNGGAFLAPASDVEFEAFEAIDATRSYGLVSEPTGDPLPGDVDAGRDRLAVAIAAELTGIAQRTLEMATDYARERQQFGRPIGAYQAVSHRLAAMLLATEESRSLTYYASWTADAEPESLPMAAAMAGARAADAGWEVPASALQVLGGIGFTWEHDLQFWLKRGRVTGRMLGSPRDHRERVAGLSGLGSGTPIPA
jgi:alkylation response protein AidB-like acyl-CoA dehydrogenase